tara:strand:+ start:2385 stop:2510 length:126 start_codon:yes stop_codon:yes gene_type:complete
VVNSPIISPLLSILTILNTSLQEKLPQTEREKLNELEENKI